MKIEHEIALRIKKSMKEKKISQEKMAKALGISRTTLTHILTGRSGISVSKIITIANVLQENTIYLTSGIVASSQSDVSIANTLSIGIPLIELQEAHRWREIMEEAKDNDNYPRIPVNIKHYNKKCFFQYVESEMMAPIFNKGEELIIDPEKTPESGNYVIVRLLESQENVIRQYLVEGSKIYLKALNDLPVIAASKSEIEICGVIVGKIIRYV